MFLSSTIIDMQAIVYINVFYCSSFMSLFFTIIVIKALATRCLFLSSSPVLFSTIVDMSVMLMNLFELLHDTITTPYNTKKNIELIQIVTKR